MPIESQRRLKSMDQDVHALDGGVVCGRMYIPLVSVISDECGPSR